MTNHPLSNVTMIDLSVVTGENYPAHWPTSPMFHTYRYVWYDDFRGAAYSRFLSIEEHHGTHFDAPAHIIPPQGSGFADATDGEWITTEKVPLTQFIGPAAVIDCRTLIGQAEPGYSPLITRQHLENWEARYGQIEASDCVLFYTGWTDLHYKPFPEGNNLAFNPGILKNMAAWPAPDVGAMELLVERGVRLVGTDGVAMGPCEDDHPPHVVGLKANMIFIEKLTNLAQLPPRGAAFLFLPLRIENGSGAPGRAVAFLPTQN